MSEERINLFDLKSERIRTLHFTWFAFFICFSTVLFCFSPLTPGSFHRHGSSTSFCLLKTLLYWSRLLRDRAEKQMVLYKSSCLFCSLFLREYFLLLVEIKE